VKIRERAGLIDSAQDTQAYKISRFLLGSLYRLQGAPEVFALDEAQDTGEYVRLAIYEEEPVAPVRAENSEG
jgi:hypothetical protein